MSCQCHGLADDCDSEECCSCLIGRNYDVRDSRWHHYLDGNEKPGNFRVLIEKLSSRAMGEVEYYRRTVNQWSVANTHILLQSNCTMRRVLEYMQMMLYWHNNEMVRTVLKYCRTGVRKLPYRAAYTGVVHAHNMVVIHKPLYERYCRPHTRKLPYQACCTHTIQ
jgi:hypothetical protein